MQKLFTLIAASVFSCTFIFAQDSQTLMATVTRIKHKTAVTENIVTKGNFYFRKPDKMSMIFKEGKDMLLMDGNTFSIINDGKSSIAKGKEANHLGLLQKVLINILSGEDGNIDNDEPDDMKIMRQENIIHITPVTTDAKAKRRMMFTSFTLTIDPMSSELKSMCMNEKGGNYTRYDFSDFEFKDAVDNNIFNPN